MKSEAMLQAEAASSDVACEIIACLMERGVRVEFLPVADTACMNPREVRAVVDGGKLCEVGFSDLSSIGVSQAVRRLWRAAREMEGSPVHAARPTPLMAGTHLPDVTFEGATAIGNDGALLVPDYRFTPSCSCGWVGVERRAFSFEPHGWQREEEAARLAAESHATAAMRHEDAAR